MSFEHYIYGDTDPTSFSNIVYAGQQSRVMWDYRNGGNWITVNAYLFTARFHDQTDVEVRCNPEFRQEEAQIQAEKYAKALGRIPKVFRSRIEILDLNKGELGWSQQVAFNLSMLSITHTK